MATGNRPSKSAPAATRLRSRLLLPEQQIGDPAATDVRAVASAVGQDGLILAARVLQGVGKDGHGGKVPAVVHLPGEGNDRGGKPRGVNGDGTERIAEDVSNEIALSNGFRLGTTLGKLDRTLSTPTCHECSQYGG